MPEFSFQALLFVHFASQLFECRAPSLFSGSFVMLPAHLLWWYFEGYEREKNGVLLSF